MSGGEKEKGGLKKSLKTLRKEEKKVGGEKQTQSTIGEGRSSSKTQKKEERGGICQAEKKKKRSHRKSKSEKTGPRKMRGGRREEKGECQEKKRECPPFLRNGVRRKGGKGWQKLIFWKKTGANIGIYQKKGLTETGEKGKRPR